MADSPNLLRAFRGTARSALPVHPLERALVGTILLHLVFLPWAVGARMPWAQIVSLGLGTIALTLALLPRRYSGDLTVTGDYRILPWPRLLRFPLFWFGLVFLGYVLIQALNPAWRWTSTNLVWFVKAVPHIEWLPHGVDAPFERMNAWRMLCIWGGAWAAVCALWTGITRRVALLSLLNGLIINGTLLALVAILQKITGATKILWFIPSPAPQFLGTFVYENHGGSFFLLMLALATGMGVWTHLRGVRRMARSTPAPIYAFAATIIASAVLMSGSRAAILLATGFVLITLLLMVIRIFARGRADDNRLLNTVFAVGSVCILIVATKFLNLDEGVGRVHRLLSGGDNATIEVRLNARAASLELVEIAPWSGWGAGSFRHVFPFKQQEYPNIYRYRGRVFFWDHAHNDFVQLLLEVGILGCIPLAAALLWGLVRLIRQGALAHPAFLLLTIGLGLPLAHAWVDFPLYNTAILTTLVVAAVGLVRWVEFDRARE
jgi:O-antigen ligase